MALQLVSYAQFLEDIRLHRALKSVENGFYIDVGANHPLDHSVTKLFYEKGWHGINIEPSPRWYIELVKDRPRDINLRLAASSAAGNAVFHDIADTGLSTLDAAIADKHVASGFHRTSFAVETRRLADLCDEHVNGDIHFLKIDVEGAEKAVIDGCDFSKYRPWIVLIESTEPMTTIPTHAEWEPTLLQNGYVFAGSDWVNRYYVAREHSELLESLSVPADDYRRAEDIAKWDELAREKDRLGQRSGSLQSTLDGLIARYAATQSEIGVLEQQKTSLRSEIEALIVSDNAMQLQSAGLKQQKTSLQSEIESLITSHNAARSEIAGLEQQKTSLRSEIEALIASDNAARSEISGLEQHRAALQSRLDEFEHSAAALHLESDALKQHTQAQNKEIDALKYQVHQFTNSRSWQLTWPLRKTVEAIRQIRRRVFKPRN